MRPSSLAPLAGSLQMHETNISEPAAASPASVGYSLGVCESQTRTKLGWLEPDTRKPIACSVSFSAHGEKLPPSETVWSL